MKRLVKISEYGYGKVNKRLKYAAEWLNKASNQTKIKQEFCDYFDYPEYWEMPKDISRRLSSDEVDFIQDQTFEMGEELYNKE